MRLINLAVAAGVLISADPTLARERNEAGAHRAAVVVVFDPGEDCDSPQIARELRRHRHSRGSAVPLGVLNVEIDNAPGASDFDPVFVEQNPGGQCLIGRRGTLHMWGDSSHIRIKLGDNFPRPAAWYPNGADDVTVAKCAYIGASTLPTCSAPDAKLFDYGPVVNSGALEFGVKYSQGAVYEYDLYLRMGEKRESITGPGYDRAKRRGRDMRKIDPMIVNH